ncbi:sulfite exporter TauE/SafE family protein [Ammoniphilus sp. CFH 90114]|uniref:sulfite exporter TauE/SafE family protein n=1 Tax=Ammoniphilus sp. CFH 90114 TaxID=2493665 RepID=UPI00100DD4BD|nr:sulfite exporter TauE/SafE family protein [Ammoniphilus sp. CFH 90114]RXT04305.1 sulfite exporter TauE/SafE family protein [Ammoniphilus sp. CFH 90114]
MLDSLFLILIGTLAGLSGSLVGLGGGFIIIPFLVYFFPLSPQLIVGTSMAVLFINSLSSTLAYVKQKRVDVQSGTWFAIAMIPGSIMGAILTKLILTGEIFHQVFGLFVLAVSIFIFVNPNRPVQLPFRHSVNRHFIDSTGSEFHYSYSRGFALMVSFVTGFLSSFLGIGGGSIMVPTMALMLNFPPHVATATSMYTILISSFSGTLSHGVLGHIKWEYVLFLSPGAFLGGQLGAKLASKLPSKILMYILGGTMILIALRMMLHL